MKTENRYIETDLGNVAPNPRGDYSAETTYEYLDLVVYQGGSYLCITDTSKGVAPESGKTTAVWQVLTLPGDLTPEYVAIHDDVVNKAASAAEDAASTAADRAAVADMKEDVEQLQREVTESTASAKADKESAAGYAAAAEASRKAATEAEANVTAQVNGFDEHVASKTLDATEAVTAAREKAVQVVDSATQAAKSAASSAADSASTATSQATAALAASKTATSAASETVKTAKVAQEDIATAKSNAIKAVQDAAVEEKKAAAASAENAATSAESAKTSADNAAQSAKSVEDASKQIEQNKKDVASLKEDLTSKADKTSLAQTDRKLDALWKLNQGISYEFQTDEAEAYQKTVPSGAKVVNVKSIGGKTIVWNQLNLNKENSITRGGISFTNNKDGSWTITGTCSAPDGNSASAAIYLFSNKFVSGHKYLVKADKYFGENYGFAINGASIPLKKTVIINYPFNPIIFVKDKVTVDNVTMRMNIFDLTRMLGAGNEPSTPEEFEAMFPADYYPYNAGELMSASVNEVIYLDTKSQETSYQIPQAILDLDGYGESGNFVDFAEKKYHKGEMTIDISGIIGDTFQELLEVEAGGTLMFKNSHGDDYRIPVPSSEEYAISLAEVVK